MDRFFPFVGAPLHLIVAGSLILTVVGVWRSADEARYVTSLSAAVVFGGYTLLTFVLSQKRETGPERLDPSQDAGPHGAAPRPGQDLVAEQGDVVNGPRGQDGSQSRNRQARRGGARVGRRRSAVERGGA